MKPQIENSDIDNLRDLQEEIDNMQIIAGKDGCVDIKEHSDCYSITVGDNTTYATKEVMRKYLDTKKKHATIVYEK